MLFAALFCTHQVILAANNGPTINDITAAELAPLVAAAAKQDAVLGRAWSSGQLRVMNSGNDLPVIDLRQVRLNKALFCVRHLDL
jgi:type II pantothenate kinase